MTDDNKLICYILMRTDAPAFDPCKAMAQAHHAGTKMAEGVPEGSLKYQHWLDEAGGFGTTIVKAVNYRQMRDAVAQAEPLGCLAAAIVHDPEYAVPDGDRMQHLPVDTCAYIFGTYGDCFSIVGDFPLLRLKIAA